MRRPLRWLAFGLAGLAAFALVAAALVYALSESRLQQRHAVPRVAIAVPTDAESIAEGRRLATVRGCYGGCHGERAEGAVMFDAPAIARLVAPNLTAAARSRTDAELALAIRHGLRPDGRSMLVMPSASFATLTDADLGRIIAFLRSLPPEDGSGPLIALGPAGRLGLAIGKFKTEAQLAAAGKAPPPAAGEPAQTGRYLALTVCGHCHGLDLRGDANPSFVSPDLALTGAYSRQDFAALLRTGTALGGRTLPTMGPFARKLLSQLTEAEIDALYAYLRQFAAAPR